MQQRRTLSAPFKVQLLVTKECNLRCTYCCAAESRRFENEPELSLSEWKSLLARLKKIGVLDVAFSGGEPFMLDGFMNILSEARYLGFSLLSVDTNGTLITEATAQALRKLNIKKIHVSLDGDEKAT